MAISYYLVVVAKDIDESKTHESKFLTLINNLNVTKILHVIIKLTL